MSQYCPPYRSSSNNIKVELDLANYATKADLNNITHVDVSSFASKTNLAALKTEVDKIDADKLKTTPADLAKLTNAVEHDVVKKTDYNTKVTSIYNYSSDSSMNAVVNAKSTLPNFKNDGRMHVHLSGNHFQQNVAGIPNNGDVINIYCVYKLDPIPSSKDTSFTIVILYLELCKLLKMLLIIQKIIIKDMVDALMKEVKLVTNGQQANQNKHGYMEIFMTL